LPRTGFRRQGPDQTLGQLDKLAGAVHGHSGLLLGDRVGRTIIAGEAKFLGLRQKAMKLNGDFALVDKLAAEGGDDGRML
jgi:hypothetical protein